MEYIVQKGTGIVAGTRSHAVSYRTGIYLLLKAGLHS